MNCDWEVEDIPVDIVIKVNIYFGKKISHVYGFEILDEQGNILIKAVTDKDKSRPDVSCYSFSIGQGERIVGIRGSSSDYQFVIGRVANQ